MNNRCQLQRGFFTLRSCEQTATHVCTSCQRSVCVSHLSARSNFLLCVECFARDEHDSATATPSTTAAADATTSYDTDWTYSQRRHYHSTHTHPSSFDDGDRDSFSTTGDDDVQAEAEDPEADFLDS